MSAARLLSVLAVFAWVAAPIASGLHERMVRHEVCEHGDIVEPGTGADAGDPDQEGEDHEHGCFFDTLAGSAAVASAAPGVVSTDADAHADVVLFDAAPRGPPLRYAPKTSPPRIA